MFKQMAFQISRPGKNLSSFMKRRRDTVKSAASGELKRQTSVVFTGQEFQAFPKRLECFW